MWPSGSAAPDGSATRTFLGRGSSRFALFPMTHRRWQFAPQLVLVLLWCGSVADGGKTEEASRNPALPNFSVSEEEYQKNAWEGLIACSIARHFVATLFDGAGTTLDSNSQTLTREPTSAMCRAAEHPRKSFWHLLSVLEPLARCRAPREIDAAARLSWQETSLGAPSQSRPQWRSTHCVKPWWK